ncbi:hypothetical protein C8J57DRAFT_1531224 [Mycena rebaudengoi]|nr:hypothetical protein C8J57DRAFT_1531224 [Mycena rebaudengoi]
MNADQTASNPCARNAPSVAIYYTLTRNNASPVPSLPHSTVLPHHQISAPQWGADLARPPSASTQRQYALHTTAQRALQPPAATAIATARAPASPPPVIPPHNIVLPSCHIQHHHFLYDCIPPPSASTCTSHRLPHSTRPRQMPTILACFLTSNPPNHPPTHSTRALLPLAMVEYIRIYSAEYAHRGPHTVPTRALPCDAAVLRKSHSAAPRLPPSISVLLSPLFLHATFRPFGITSARLCALVYQPLPLYAHNRRFTGETSSASAAPHHPPQAPISPRFLIIILLYQTHSKICVSRLLLWIKRALRPCN